MCTDRKACALTAKHIGVKDTKAFGVEREQASHD
jgi:hypothetical protein